MDDGDHRRPPKELTGTESSKNGVQFGCGAAVGIFIPFGTSFFGYSILRSGIVTMLGASIGSALLFGFLAYQFGDWFWERLNWFRWW